jgi:hypothetical protein
MPDPDVKPPATTPGPLPGLPPEPAPAPRSPPLTRGRIVDFRFLSDGQVVTRSALVVDVANPGDPAPIADLHVFHKPGELPGPFVRCAAWDPTGSFANTWSWPPRV